MTYSKLSMQDERNNLLCVAINLMIELGTNEVVLNSSDFDFSQEFALAMETKSDENKVIIRLIKNEDVDE